MFSLIRSSLLGALGFAAVSLAAYSIWAFAPRIAGGELGLYAAITLVFLVGTGLALHRLLDGERRLARFYGFFLPGFIGYAVLWSLAWFVVKGRPGEWVGAAVGTLFFAFITWRSLGRAPAFWLGAAVLFTLHTLGYFLGSECWTWSLSKMHAEELTQLKQAWPSVTKAQLSVGGKLGWGLCHGLGFGAGIGFVMGLWQQQRMPIVTERPD